jgi:hypothetical protein
MQERVSLRGMARIGCFAAASLLVSAPAVAQNYKSADDPLTARNGGNDVAYMYGSFVKEQVGGDDYMRNNTNVKNADLDHAVYEQTDYYWMNADGFWVGGEMDQSSRYQTAGWHFQYDHSLRQYNSWAYGDMETAVLQDLNFRPDPSSPVETSRNFWF